MDGELRAHQRRRDAGAPVVTVLIGPLPATRVGARRYAREVGSAVLNVAGAATAGDEIVQWYAEQGAFRLALVDLIVEALGTSTDAVERLLGQPAELTRTLERLDGEVPGTALGVLADASSVSLEARLRLIAATMPGACPLVVVEAPTASDAATMTALVERAPWVGEVLLVSDDQWETLRVALGGSRAFGLLAEGTIHLDEAAEARRVEAQLAAASAQLTTATSDIELGAARSAVEAHFFDMLELRSETSGVFELNGSLPIRFGPRDMEVDFLSRKLWIAVEIDGHHHFQEPDAYRRDRRKDVLLQRHGFVVARFLDSDVYGRLGDVLRCLGELVAWRRESLSNHAEVRS